MEMETLKKANELVELIGDCDRLYGEINGNPSSSFYRRFIEVIPDILNQIVERKIELKKEFKQL